MLAGNGRIRYEPHALVLHYHRRDMEALKRQLYNNGKSYGVYLVKRWQEHKLSRRALLAFVLCRWAPWLFARLLLLRHPLPFALRWAEFWGATHSIWAYWRTYQSDRRIRGQSTTLSQEKSTARLDRI